MSGSALSSWAIAPHAERYAKYLTKSVNCMNDDYSKVVDCLRAKPLEELMKVQYEDIEADDDGFYETTFGPIIDNLVIPADPQLLMDLPNMSHELNPVYAKIKSKSLNLGFGSYPIMFGVTRVESPVFFSKEDQKQGIESKERDSILRRLIKKVVSYYQEVRETKNTPTEAQKSNLQTLFRQHP